jgi:hypothetical protein
VPSGNNAAEREIRMGKLRIKVSGCMRSITGAQNFCAIRSCLTTAAKHGIGMLDALTQAATGTAWIPAGGMRTGQATYPVTRRLPLPGVRGHLRKCKWRMIRSGRSRR